MDEADPADGHRPAQQPGGQQHHPTAVPASPGHQATDQQQAPQNRQPGPRVGQPAAEGQEFSMPAWIPGSYLVRDYARHVISVAAECDGEAVSLHKIDKSTWRAAAVAADAEGDAAWRPPPGVFP